MPPALALLEFESIALGIVAGDAMAKRTPLAKLATGTVHPGKYLVLAAGEVGEVQEAMAAAREATGDGQLDLVFLPAIHPEVVEALAGARRAAAGEALGIVETATVATMLEFVDAALKGADVVLTKLALADGLGGKAYALLAGSVSAVEAALELGEERLGPTRFLLARRIIPQLDAVMAANLEAPGEFARGFAPAGA